MTFATPPLAVSAAWARQPIAMRRMPAMIECAPLMALDLVLRNARVPDATGHVYIAIRDGRIASVSPGVRDLGAQEIDIAGKLVIPGLAEPLFHLHKALLGAGAPADAA